MSTVGALLGVLTMALMALAVGGRWFEVRRVRQRLRTHWIRMNTMAMVVAQRKGSRVVSPIHFAFASLGVPDVVRAMEARGISVGDLRSALEVKLKGSQENVEESPPPLDELTFSPEALRVIREATARRASSDASALLTSMVKFLAADEQAGVNEVLSSHGVDRDWLVEPAPEDPPGAGQAERRPYRALPTAGDARVVFWNDDVSKMEEIVAVLEEVFGMGTAEASHYMMEAHQAGQATVRTCGEQEAASLVAQATAAARARGMPTRITVERASLAAKRRWVGWLRRRSSARA